MTDRDEEVRRQAQQLPPKAVFDHRHPVMYEDSIAGGVTALVGYFAALARRDIHGMAEHLHFPHATVEGTDVVIIESPEQLVEESPASMDMGALAKGSFDLLMGIETYTSDPVRAGLTLSYSRHRPDGRKMLVCDGLYVATNNGGRWGLEVSSTIFTPAEHLGITYPEAEQAVLKHGHDWMEGWSESDAALLDSTRGLLGRSVGLYPNITPLNRDLGRLFRTEDVVSRLRVTDRETVEPGRYDFEAFRENVAGHGLGGYAFTLHRPDARLVHQARNKAHVAAGYTRFQADGTPISVTHGLSVHVRRDLQWGSVAGTGNTIHYDATNNARSV